MLINITTAFPYISHAANLSSLQKIMYGNNLKLHPPLKHTAIP